MFKKQEKLESKLYDHLLGWKNSALVRFLLFFALGLIFFISLYDKLIQQTYDISVGSPAENTIMAPPQAVNPDATQQAKEDAADKVQLVYRTVDWKNQQISDAIFDKLSQVNFDDEVAYNDKVSIYRTVLPGIVQEHEDRLFRSFSAIGMYNESLINEMKKNINDQQYRIPEEAYYKLPRLTKEDLNAMAPVARDILTKLMNEQIIEAQTARVKVAELVSSSSLTKNTTRELVQEVIRISITPNKFYDVKATEDAKNKAKDEVKPVYYGKNDVLVYEGQIITNEIYDLLKSLDMLKSNNNGLPLLGLALLSSLLALLMYVFIRQSGGSSVNPNVQLIMLLLIFVINIAGMKIIALGQNLDNPYIGYLAPTAMGAMLITILLGSQLAFMSSVSFSILASVLLNTNYDLMFDFRFGLVTLAICFTAVFTIQKASQRSTILKAGMMVASSALLTIGAMLLMETAYSKREIVFSSGYAVSGGVLTAVLVIGLLPFFELAFGILSPLKLVELSNPNHPLLRKLLTETPGTYHHSIMVGNLSEAAAESIGANGLLCRVGSYYHDIGKTKRPIYFIENQGGMENPHDRIDPYLSKSIIVAHARDGVEMLKEYKLPKAIQDIAEQHHGTTLLQFFYHKAIKQAEEEGRKVEKPVVEQDFRYPGPKASSKEAAIVGIADCVEAAVRSLRNPTMEQINMMVRKIIKARLDDGQFNECDLTLKELDQIAKTLNETLLGIFHSRIEYPAELPTNKTQSEGA